MFVMSPQNNPTVGPTYRVTFVHAWLHTDAATHDGLSIGDVASWCSALAAHWPPTNGSVPAAFTRASCWNRGQYKGLIRSIL